MQCKTCICRCRTFTYILSLTFKASYGIWSDIRDCISCADINHFTYQMDVRGCRRSSSSSLTWTKSGWSPRSDRLAPSAPQNVPFLPVLMNPGREKNMNGGISGDQVLITCRSTELLQGRSIFSPSFSAPFTTDYMWSKTQIELFKNKFNLTLGD